MAEAPKPYINTQGTSTEHAKRVAEQTQTELNRLDEAVKQAIPEREGLDFPERANLVVPEYEIKRGDYITKVLKEQCAGAKYDNAALLKLSYAFMFKEGQTKGMEVNFLEVGDKMKVENGTLFVTRKPGSKFKNIEVDIFPWESGDTGTTDTGESTLDDEGDTIPGLDEPPTSPDPVDPAVVPNQPDEFGQYPETPNTDEPKEPELGESDATDEPVVPNEPDEFGQYPETPNPTDAVVPNQPDEFGQYPETPNPTDAVVPNQPDEFGQYPETPNTDGFTVAKPEEPATSDNTDEVDEFDNPPTSDASDEPVDTDTDSVDTDTGHTGAIDTDTYSVDTDTGHTGAVDTDTDSVDTDTDVEAAEVVQPHALNAQQFEEFFTQIKAEGLKADPSKGNEPFYVADYRGHAIGFAKVRTGVSWLFGQDQYWSLPDNAKWTPEEKQAVVAQLNTMYAERNAPAPTPTPAPTSPTLDTDGGFVPPEPDLVPPTSSVEEAPVVPAEKDVYTPPPTE